MLQLHPESVCETFDRVLRSAVRALDRHGPIGKSAADVNERAAALF